MKRTITPLLALLVVGCATVPTAETNALRGQVKSTVPTCKTDKECEVKWAAARQWVTTNSGYRFQHLTADYMETYNAVNSSVELAARVTKNPQSDGSYRIEASVWCDNWMGCRMPPLEALLHFNQTVTSAWKP